MKVERSEVPLIKQPPDNPLEKLIVLAAGIAPQATVMLAGAIIVANAAGLTVIVLETGASALPQASVAVHVSVTVPPQASGVVVNVEGLEVPLIKQPVVSPLVKGIELDTNCVPQGTVIFSGAIIIGRTAGVTVIFCMWVIVLLYLSV